VFLDFAWFREQTCLVACPYGRLQSALLDRQSVIVAYDVTRGEPRGHGVGARPGLGDCVACNACVNTCPTGIDIRDGLQMECIHCTQCADACDSIMEKVGKPAGLIRYSSQDALAGKPPKILRVRTVLYPLAFVAFFGAFLVTLATRSTADVTLLGPIGAPFVVDADGRIRNQVRIKVASRSREMQRYVIEYIDDAGATMVAPENPLPVAAGASVTTSVFVMQSMERFANGERRVRFRISDGSKFAREFAWRLPGPSHRDAAPEPQ
jgi:cytochrome c oxidase accessory protein FixG